MNQKLEDSLALALDTSVDERKKTADLNTGYHEEDNSWELIIKYTGDIDEITSDSIAAEELYGGYAIVRISQDRIADLTALPQVEYIEKPKRLFFQTYEGRYAACITQVQNPPESLSGEGCIVGVVDSGVDYAHPDFRNEDGTTRILKLWDQGIPSGEYDSEMINQALLTATPQEQHSIVPSVDVTGHGTAVLGIAAGNGRASQGENKGVASQAELIVVKMGAPGYRSFPRTTELMRGVDYCIRQAVAYQKPLALNISFGNNYGSHDGNSLLETYLDNVAGIGRTTIVVATGNEGGKRRHTSGNVLASEPRLVELAIGEAEENLNLQIWKEYVDEYEIRLVAPSGNSTIISESAGGIYQSRLDNTVIRWIFGEPSPYNLAQEIYLEFFPDQNRTSVRSGIWKILLIPKKVVSGQYDMWLPAGTAIGETTGFLIPEQRTTLTIPSTAAKVISVGAYNQRTDSLATFSGWGPTLEGAAKPDLVAPGVEILTTAPGGVYSLSTGTSMAAPFVTGSAALLMEWGIVRGNDPYLYGEKVKAYLIKGAKQLSGMSNPNPMTGWGALCLKDSLPI